MVRIDAAKHIAPDDLVGILTKLRTNLGTNHMLSSLCYEINQTVIRSLHCITSGGKMPEDWITYLEVLLGGEADMLMCNPESGAFSQRVVHTYTTNALSNENIFGLKGYNYGIYLENALLDAGWSSEDIQKVKIWNSGYPKEPEKGYCTISPKVGLAYTLLGKFACTFK